MSARKQPKTLAKFNFINQFTAGYIGINSRLSGIEGEGYTEYYHKCCPTGLIRNHGSAQNTQEGGPD